MKSRLKELGDSVNGMVLNISLDEFCENFVDDLYKGRFNSHYELFGQGHQWAFCLVERELFLDEFTGKLRDYVNGFLTIRKWEKEEE